MSQPVAPWRPVQYLGSKLRTLEHIVDALGGLQAGGGVVWEPFTGSTVVSQTLAQAGYTVCAGDALYASATFATAVLGVGRGDETVSLPALACRIVDEARRCLEPDLELWASWLTPETKAVEDRDGLRLIKLGAELPQRWRRSTGEDRGLRTIFEAVEVAANERRLSARGLTSTTYAGTYFGLRQALELDTLREAIDRLATAGVPSNRWTRACMLTALAHAASAAVFSPGKHFAQPHRVHDGKDLGFHARRIVADRSTPIYAKFLEASTRLEEVARGGEENHRAEHERVEQMSADRLIDWGVDVVYADPPYTAQQYSRFYHVLETLMESVPAKLQEVRGSVTRGLYPEGRYLSPFCSRVKATPAIDALARTAAKAGASLVVSYSDSMSDSTGNARSIPLPTLVSTVEQAYGRSAVSVRRLPLRYRQFNHSSAGISNRDDPEFLVVANVGGLRAS